MRSKGDDGTMPLHLIIENETSLPDGGPLSHVLTGTRGIDIGRDQYLDWTLPDPDRAVSGKHCEVRFRDGAYWLYDVSRNGTFVNYSAQRLQEPHRLRHGDRICIGPYIIRAEIDGEGQPGHTASPEPYDPADPWGVGGASPPPIPRRDLQPTRTSRPVNSDFQDWRIDLPNPLERGPIGPLPPLSPNDSFGHEGEMSWARGLPSRRPEAEPVPIPRPRQPGPPPEQTGNGSPFTPPPPRPAPSPAPPSRSAPSSLEGPDHDSWPAESPWGQPSLAVPPPRRAKPAPRPAAATEPISADAFVERFARGAGIPPEVLAWRDSGDLAEEIGALTRLAAENLKVLLAARAEAKRVARASSQTMIQALDNNPLKFTPTVEDALRIMFSRPVSGYMPARVAMEEGFCDLKTHQVKVYAAMQHALRLLLQDLDPDAVEASLGDDRGLSGLLGSRKARLWDVYATRWDALTAAHEEGIVDAFMIFFAECYDRGGRT